MSVASFDTLKFANRLKQAGVPERQAEAEAEALAEVLEVNLKDLATRDDLLAVEIRLQARMDKFEAKIAGDFARLEGEVTRLAGDSTRLSGDFTRLSGDFAGLSGDFARLSSDFLRLSGEMTLLKWMLGLVLGGILALILKAFFPFGGA
jgi:hypothetical protein